MWPQFERDGPFQRIEFTRSELALACMVWGSTMGFGYFVLYHAYGLSARIKRFNQFIALVWTELFVCLLCGLILILVVTDVLPQDNFWVWLFVILTWMLQLQCLIQIIANRICVLIDHPKNRTWLKLGLFIWIALINVTVACIWIPAVLQLPGKYHDINVVFDRIEKFLYLITDAGLNYYFIWIVQRRLVSAGLTKYSKLMRFNQMIIWVSLGMDVLIIGVMFMRNPLLYTMFHPFAFIVKLEIEMTMSDLIIVVARGTGVHVDEFQSSSGQPSFPTQRAGVESVRVHVHQEAVSVFDNRDVDEHSSHDVKTPPSQAIADAIPMKSMKGDPKPAGMTFKV